MFGNGVPIKEIKNFSLQRKVAAHKTVESWDNIPHAGVIVEFDVTNVLKYARELQQQPEFAKLKVTINVLMLKIIAESFKECMDLNAYVKYNKKSSKGRTIIMDDVNIAMPLILPDGRTITPVMQQADKKSIKEICEEMIILQKKIVNTNIDMLLYTAALRDTMEKLKKGKLIGVIRRGISNFFGKDKIKITKEEKREYKKIPDSEKITADDLLSATVLCSNIGPAFKGLPCYIGMLEIIPPQSTVIGLASVRKQPVAVKDKKTGEYKVEIRDILPTTLYADHRGMDFAPAVPTIQKWYDLCLDPKEGLKDWIS